MALGLGRMRLEPSAFWAMTPREFALAAGLAGMAPMHPQRSDLARLMQRYPDLPTERAAGGPRGPGE